MLIVYNEWIIKYHKDWRAYKPQVWRNEFGPIIITNLLSSAAIWMVPGTEIE